MANNASFIAHNLWCDPMERLLQQALQSRRFHSETIDPFQLPEANDIDLSSGAKILRNQLDLCLPDPLPLLVSRSYSSQHSDETTSPQVGLLGPGWWLPHEATLHLSDDVLMLHNGPASHVRLPVLAPGEMTYSAAHGLWVVRGGNEQLEVASRHPAAALRMLWRSLHPSDRRRESFFFVAHHALGPWWIFGRHREEPLASGQRLPLRGIRDRFGRMLQFGHDPHTGLTTVAEDSSGRQFRLELKYFPQLVRKTAEGWGVDNGWRMLGVHIIKDAHVQEAHPIKPHEPPVVRYEYTSRGELAGVCGPSEMLLQRFDYHEQQIGRIATHARAGRADVSFDYNDAGRVIEQRIANGLKLRFQYDQADRQDTTTITDSLGRQRVLQFARIGDRLHAVRLKRADSSSVSRRFDEHGLLIASTDALGRATHFERDEISHQLLCVREPGGKQRQMAYNAQGQLVGITFACGTEFRYQYDLIGRLIASTGTTTRTTRLRYAHDQTNLPSLIEDARGNKLQLHWTPEGLLASLIDIHGQSIHFEHDRWGHLIRQRRDGEPLIHSIRDSHGRQVESKVGANPSTLWQYNPAGDLIHWRDPAGTQLLVKHDAHGRVLLQQIAGLCVEYRYDVAGRLIAITGKKGGTLRFAYDTVDRVVEQIDVDGSVRTFRYNTAGELFAPVKKAIRASGGHQAALARSGIDETTHADRSA